MRPSLASFWMAEEAGKKGSSAKLGEAIDHFREAVDAAPDLAQPHFDLAEALAAMGWLDEVVKQYQ